MALIIITGDVGSGKTLMATIIAYYTSKDRIILSNYHINVDNYHPLEPEKLIDLDESKKYLVIIDECYTWLESYTSSKATERYLSYILFQSRKRNIDIVLTSQLVRRINVNFREMESLRIECSRDIDRGCFVYRFSFMQGFEPIELLFELCEEDAKKFYSLYDTKQMIISPDFKDMSLDFVLQDPKKLRKLVNDVCAEIKPMVEGKKITKSLVSTCLLEKGYSKKLLNHVYDRLRSELV